MAKRGELTPELKQEMETFLGREVDETELRLMPYVAYCLVNSRNLDPNKVSGPEREILSKWRAAGHVEGGASFDSLRSTRAFWDFMQGVIYKAYAAYDD